MHFIHLQTGKKRLKTKSFSRPASSLHKPWCLQLLPSSQTSSTNNSLLQLQMQSSNCCIIFKMLKAANASEKNSNSFISMPGVFNGSSNQAHWPANIFKITSATTN
jgi:hypothetical protein